MGAGAECGFFLKIVRGYPSPSLDFPPQNRPRHAPQTRSAPLRVRCALAATCARAELPFRAEPRDDGGRTRRIRVTGRASLGHLGTIGVSGPAKAPPCRSARVFGGGWGDGWMGGGGGDRLLDFDRHRVLDPGDHYTDDAMHDVALDRHVRDVVADGVGEGLGDVLLEGLAIDGLAIDGLDGELAGSGYGFVEDAHGVSVAWIWAAKSSVWSVAWAR